MDYYESNGLGRRRMKNKNWTKPETTLLIDTCVANIEIVNGDGDKSSFWDETANSINALNLSIRTPHEVRRKWTDYKSLTKKKEQARKLALRHGVEPPRLTELEKKLLSVLPGHLFGEIDSDTDTYPDLGIVKIEKDDSSNYTDEGFTIGKAIRVIVENEARSTTGIDTEILLPADDHTTNTPASSAKRKFDDFKDNHTCSCSRHLLNIEQDILHESKRRNTFLEKLTSQMDSMIKLKADKLALMRRINNIEPQDRGGESPNS